MLLQPVFARGRLQMADEINENHDDDRENVRGREGGDEKGERGEQATLEVNDHDPRKKAGVECRGAHRFAARR